MQTPLTIALAGNPNSGKTSLFNALTGARQHVGNYPGVTVELKEGRRRHHGRQLRFVDLPGTYSLTAHSEEERVARDFIVEQRPDVLINVIDASNLERNLYLTLQLRELGVPLVLAFNMSDQAREMGIEFDLGRLEESLGCRIVPTVGYRGEGIAPLVEAVLETAGTAQPGTSARTDYGEAIEAAILPLVERLGGSRRGPGPADPRWVAVKLLESDQVVGAMVPDPGVRTLLEETRAQLEATLGEPVESAIAGRRYDVIASICRDAVRRPAERPHTFSDRIDAWATHRWLGIPLFLGLMFLVFHLTFTLGEPFMNGIEAGIDRLADALPRWLPRLADGPLMALLVDGVLRGVGGVVVFLPNILFLFLAIAALEDTGYMARAAFIMDRLMNRIGLHGKSFIALMVGFGCSVPAILATRTLENRRDRLTTMMVVPLMSCGARIPIYALIIPAFFAPRWHGPMLWLIYIIGIVLAIVGAKLLRHYVLPGESVPFVMELPPYRLPTPGAILQHTWERGWLYLKKAGTIILGLSIVLWALTSYPKRPEPDTPPGAAAAEVAEVAEAGRAADDLAYSAAGRIGRGLEPVLRPMGFDWRIGTALIGAFAAKEVFVAQMGIVFAVDAEEDEQRPLRERLQETYSPLVGFCIMLFCLISAPCIATIAATRRESGSWRWALAQLGGLTLLAYVVTTLVFQVGRLLGHA